MTCHVHRALARSRAVLCCTLILLALAACGPDLSLLSADHGLDITAITLTGKGTGYAVGLQPGQHRAVLLVEQQGAWSLDPSQPPVNGGDNLKAVVVVGSDLWVAGSNTDDAHGNVTQTTGFIAHRDAHGQWQRQKFGASINALCFLSAIDGWAVGDGGLILHGQAGAWTAVPDAMSDNLEALAFRTPQDGWAVGDMGAFVHFDGTAWTHPPHFSHEHIASVALSPTDGWAVGADGTVFRWQLRQWDGFTAPINTNNQAVLMTAGSVWIAGDHGTIFQFDLAGTSWQHLTPPADVQLNVLAIDSAGTLWTGGNSPQPVLYALDTTAPSPAWRTVTVTLK